MKICIVGGGTAGWLAALLLSKNKKNHEYTVIESSDVGIIGVGEAVTGLFRSIILDPFYGCNELDFFKETDATPKLGIRFINWNGDGKSFDNALEGSYSGDMSLDMFLYTAILHDMPIEYVSSSSTISLQEKTNFYIENEQLKFDYGLHVYHLDAYKVGKYFKKICLESKNVKHIDQKIVSIKSEGKCIKSLHLANGDTIEADLFIDCSGFHRLLSSELKQPIVSYDEFIPVNSTYLFKLKEDTSAKRPVSAATSFNSGWMFEIPTRNRIGRGYVYNSEFIDEDTAHREIESYFGTEIEKVKSLKFKNTRLENSLYGNCLSVGLASCFVEPLQATSIHATILQLQNFYKNVLTDDIESTLNEISVRKYNSWLTTMYNEMADFVSVHYVCKRQDTDFWKWVKHEKPKTDNVKEILELSKTRLTRINDYKNYWGAPGKIWNLSLAGMEVFDKDIIRKQLYSDDINENLIISEINFRVRKLTEESKKYITTDQFNSYIKNLKD